MFKSNLFSLVGGAIVAVSLSGAVLAGEGKKEASPEVVNAEIKAETNPAEAGDVAATETKVPTKVTTKVTKMEKTVASTDSE